ncbi:MAG TPA: undecaprenyl-diphosphate phosphatase [Salinivirgaceae bacterium]|nr:undecaprenyl-diphosphate phosphatase [Salinivirgaceae bacterium]
MDILKAIILGAIQGITEFLPISSSGHLKLGEALLNTSSEDSLMFTVLVHGATVLSTLVVFRKDILEIFKGLFKFQWNEETKYTVKIFISMIPVAIVGLFFKDYVENIFESKSVAFIGYMLLITAALLFFAWLNKSEKNRKEVGFFNSLIIGIAQAIAVIPGISRSGATIATALILKIDRAKAAKFSFLMVIIPILGENFLDLIKGNISTAATPTSSLIAGFITAFVIGLLACKFMIKVVTKGRLHYFAIYCAVVGLSVILFM